MVQDSLEHVVPDCHQHHYMFRFLSPPVEFEGTHIGMALSIYPSIRFTHHLFVICFRFLHTLYQTADQIDLKLGICPSSLWDSPSLIKFLSCSNECIKAHCL